jgi:hypothetical protein
MTVYILENKVAQRVKVGTTNNTTQERLRAIRANWHGLSATCQVCGTRRDITGSARFNHEDCHMSVVMPKHPSNGTHATHPDSFFKCLGSGALPLELDTSLAEKYLSDLKTNHLSLSGTEKSSSTKMINTLEARIARYKALGRSEGDWVIARAFRGSGENVERLAHEILKDTLDTDALIGEVFKCSVAEAVSAVEEAIGRLSGTS